MGTNLRGRTTSAVAVVALVAVLALLLSGFAWGAIPNDSDGVIFACYKNSSGTLRVLDNQATPQQTCSPNEP